MSEPASDEAKFEAFGQELLTAAEESVGPWVERRVAERFGGLIPPEFADATTQAAAAATANVAAGLSELIATDIDQQRTTPLSVIRTASSHATAVLAAAGVPDQPRDPDAVRLHPDDRYDLAIGSFGELSDQLQEAGIKWGAGKAHIHLARRRAEAQG